MHACINTYRYEHDINIIGCPSIVRSEYGTENCSLAAIQVVFRYYHSDSRARQRALFMDHPKQAWYKDDLLIL